MAGPPSRVTGGLTQTPSVDRVPIRSRDQLNLHQTLAQLASATKVSKAVADAVKPLGLKQAALIHIAKQLVESRTYGRFKGAELLIHLGGMTRPGTVNVGIAGQGLSLPFDVATGNASGLLDPQRR